eukprot:4458-Heterococcus_DN1.PRE.1
MAHLLHLPLHGLAVSYQYLLRSSSSSKNSSSVISDSVKQCCLCCCSKGAQQARETAVRPAVADSSSGTNKARKLA